MCLALEKILPCVECKLYIPLTLPWCFVFRAEYRRTRTVDFLARGKVLKSGNHEYLYVLLTSGDADDATFSRRKKTDDDDNDDGD